jgi:hypothetical protein
MIDKIEKRNLILLFLLSPILGLISLLKIKDENSIIFFGTLFFGLLGSVFVYVSGTDGYSHLMNAQNNYLNMSFEEFFEKSFEIFSFNSTSGSTDLYLHCIKFFSSSLLQSPTLIHVFTGLVLGYFFIKSVLLVLKDNIFDKKSYILLGFIFLFLLIRSVGALNSIRMWTGMWVLFYGTYSFAITKNKKYFLVILFSVFVHFSYVVVLIPIVLSYLFQNSKKVLVALYIISFFTSVSFSYFSAYLPKSDLLENKQKYNVIDSDEKAGLFKERAISSQVEKSNLNFYKASGELNYLNYSIVGLSAILLFFYFKSSVDLSFKFLIATGIGLYTFANFVAFSPSLQGRVKMIAATFILAAAIHLICTIKKYKLNNVNLNILNRVLTLFLISSIPMALFQISYIFQNISFFLLLFPQLSWFIGDSDISIRTAIGFFID